MRKSGVFLAAAALLVGTLASGWLHGNSARRWGPTDALDNAATRLQGALPAQLGPWRLAKQHAPEEGVAEVLQCAAYFHGVYSNDETGETVGIALVAGPSGPISVHTPEICYSALDYEMAGQRQRVAVNDKNGQTHSLWQVHANSRHASRPNRRVLYGWSSGRAWEAPAGPRFAFAGLPVLYKLQLAGPSRDTQTNPAADPCQDFLFRFLAHVQPRLITTSRIPPVGR